MTPPSRKTSAAVAAAVDGTPTPMRVYNIPTNLSRSEAFRFVRKMDPERKHASFSYDKRTGVARSLQGGGD